jgi:hypothetical protein
MACIVITGMMRGASCFGTRREFVSVCEHKQGGGRQPGTGLPERVLKALGIVRPIKCFFVLSTQGELP